MVATAVELLKLHIQTAHGDSSKPENPKRPKLVLSGDAVEAKDFDKFSFLLAKYKSLAGIKSEHCAPTHVLECLSSGS